MSRPRRNTKAPKYDTEESDEEQDSRMTEVESNSNSDSAGLPLDESDDDPSETLDISPLFSSIPNASQVLQTRSFIVQQAATVALLQEKYREQKKITDNLEEKLKHAEKVLSEAQATIAPIIRVPPEVLALIFTAHVRENHESPWLLMQVSRSWRAAALETRAIWGAIVLAPSNWTKSKGGGRVRIYDGMEVCCKPPQLLRALLRAGATPLDLKIMLTPGSQRSPNHDSDLLGLINWVATHQKNTRLRSLGIAAGGRFTLPSGRFRDFDFSGLVSLKLDRDYPDLIDKVVAEAKGMHTLHVAPQSLDKMGDCTWWHQLEDFSVDALYAVERVEKFMLGLSSATGLTSLRLGAGHLNSSEQTNTISLPSLRRFESHAVSNLWIIDCPNLTHLSLHVTSSYDDLTNRRIYLPYLVEMLLHTQISDVAPVFDVPSLVTLDLRFGWSKAAGASLLKRTWPAPKIGIDIPSSNLEPKTLWFRNTEINPKIFARSLAGRQVLEEIFTIDCPITEEFFDNLLPAPVGGRAKKPQGTRGRGGSKWEVPCPALRVLVVDLAPRKKFVKAAILASARKLLAGRIEAGAPLERLGLRFSKDEGWEELIDIAV